MPPAAPTNLTAIAGDRQITLTFSGSANALSYRLYWSNAATVSKTTGTVLSPVTSPALHQGLANGTSYFYVVTAVNSAGESADSAVASAIPSALATAMNPQLLVRRPDVGATAVRVGSRVDVRFDRDLDGTSANSSTVSLRLLDGGVVMTTIAAGGPTLSLTPSGPLAFETTYRVSLTTGLRDSLNQPLQAPDSWTFTTGSPPPSLTVVPGNSRLSLRWTAVPGATSAVVTRTQGTSRASYTVSGTEYADANVSNGVAYTYVVSAVTPFGVGAPSMPVVAVPSPSRPFVATGVQAVAGRSTVLLTWNSVGGASGYSIWRAPRAGGPYTQLQSAWPSTTFLDDGRPGDLPVAYVVQAESSNGTSAFSDEAVDVTNSALLPAPAPLTATAGNGWTRVAWAAVPGAQGYVVWRSTFPNTNPTRVAWVTSGTRFDDLGVSVGETYRYFVGAVSQQTVGDLAEAVSSPIPGLTPPPAFLYTPNVDVNQVSNSVYSPSINGTTTEFFRSTSPDGGFTQVAANDLTAVGGTRYFYIARFNVSGVLGEFSAPVDITPAIATTPAMPTNVAASVSSGGADVTFDPVPNATGYQVGRATTSGGAYSLGICSVFDAFENRCVVGSLTDNQTVYLAVRALNGSTPGPWSAELMVRPTNMGTSAGLARPTIAAFPGNGVITVGWTLVPNANSYRVFRRTPRTPWVLLTTTPALSVNDTTVTNGVEYRYAVLATNLTPPNNRFSTLAMTGFERPTLLDPPRPTGVTVTPTNGGALVRWTPIAGARSYSVAAAFNAGGAPSNAVTSCTTFEPWPATCQLSLDNGTAYVVSMTVTTPNGVSAYTDELAVTPNPLAPPIPPSLTISPGNERLTIAGTESLATTWHLWRRTRSTPLVDLGIFQNPFVTETQFNGVPFEYSLQAITAAGVSPVRVGQFEEATAAAPPSPVITEVTAGAGRLSVSWTPVPGAPTYTVRTSDNPVGPFSTYTTLFDPFATVTSLFLGNGTPHYIVVLAASSSGTSAPSLPQSGTPTAGALAPPAPVFINGNQAVELSWPAVPGATSYQIARRSPSTEWAPLATLTSPRHLDFNVENGESWLYLVRAVGASGPGVWSSPSAEQDVLSTLPMAPGGVSVRPALAGLFVEWQPVAGATTYSVLSADQPDGPFSTDCTNFQEWETRCRISATAGQPSFVVVRATNSQGPGVTSVVRTATPSTTLPGVPSVTVTSPGPAGSLRLTWSAVSGATTYRVYRRLVNGAPAQVQQTSALVFVDSGLTSGQAYVYYVEAENAAGRGAWSVPDTATAP